MDEKEEENGKLKLGIVREMHESTERQKMEVYSLKLKVRRFADTGEESEMWKDR